MPKWNTPSQPAITCSKLTIETLEQGVKYELVNAGWDKHYPVTHWSNIYHFSVKLFTEILSNVRIFLNSCNGVWWWPGKLTPLAANTNLRPIFPSSRKHLVNLHCTCFHMVETIIIWLKARVKLIILINRMAELN